MPEKIIKNIIVKGHVAEIFQLWADFENFPSFMKNIKSVTKTGDRKSHWVMHVPVGKDLEWDAQTTDVQENRRIAWNSISGDIQTSGQVTFKDISGDETEVTVQMQYTPPAGQLGKVVAHVFENPDKRAEEDLNQFKKFAEGRINTVTR